MRARSHGADFTTTSGGRGCRGMWCSSIKRMYLRSNTNPFLFHSLQTTPSRPGTKTHSESQRREHTSACYISRTCPPTHGRCHTRDEPIALRSSFPAYCREKLIQRRRRLFCSTRRNLDLQGRVVAAESGGESGTAEAASSRDAHTRVISGPFPDQAPRFCIQPPPTLATDSSLASCSQGCLENRRPSQCV